MARNTALRGMRDVQTSTDEDVVEDLTLPQRIKGLRDRLKLGPHHKMERFTILLTATVSILLLFTGVSFTVYRSDVSNLASSQALFTEDFTYSLSNQPGYVEGIYGNDDLTDVMVLFRMQNPHEMSANAENYELFVTEDKGSMKYEPDMSFALFGTTGYGIIRFQNDEPLPSTVLNVTIRSNASLSETEGSGATDGQDESFNQFDQATIYVNPGATNITRVEDLTKGETDPRKLYIALVAEQQDAEYQESIATQTDELDKLMKRAAEYTNRLVSAGYEPPAEPWFIKGDYIDETGVFRPASNVSLAYEFDYWSKTIRDGYLNQVIADMSEYDEYMLEHSQENVSVSDSEASERSEDVEPVIELKHTDGSVLNLETVITGQSASSQVAAKDSTDSLLSTWRTYASTKGTLQRETLRSLLVLDADVQSQPVGYSEHTGDSVVSFY